MAWMAKQIRSAGTRRKPLTVDPSQCTVSRFPACTSCPKSSAYPVEDQSSRTRLQEQLRRLPVLSYQHQAENRVCGQPGSVRLVNMQMVKAVSFLNANNNQDFRRRRVYSHRWGCGTGSPRSRHHFYTRATNYLLSGNSVLPYDVYVWLTGTFRKPASRPHIGLGLAARTFRRQHQGTPRFKAKFREALKKIHDVYPAANVETNRKGLFCIHPHLNLPPKAERRKHWTRAVATGSDRPLSRFPQVDSVAIKLLASRHPCRNADGI